MGDVYVMRRANGDLFTEEINGRLRIPVWTSEEAVARYRERNPELLTFLPARLNRPLISRIKSGLGSESTTEFLLLSEDDPDADLTDGRPLSLDEIFPDGEHASQPALQV
jgi:hypothetical protein